MEPIKRISGKDIGPNIEPIDPNKIKSPPPIPSFLENILKIKLVSHKEKYPSTKPQNPNKPFGIDKRYALSSIKILKK
tara:strand:- start:208 stop:441 length:234 start_codon:yes stop_codon:yes gene_type:complete